MSGRADPVIVVPGLNGSGPTHWQSWIEALICAQCVEQDDWARPDIDLWSARVEQAIFAQTRAGVAVSAQFWLPGVGGRRPQAGGPDCRRPAGCTSEA